MRPPMLLFEFDAVLLPFQYHKPALVPLFQFPPQLRTGCRAYTTLSCQKLSAKGKVSPLTIPLVKRVYSKGDHRRRSPSTTQKCYHSSTTSQRSHRCSKSHRSRERFHLATICRSNKNFRLHQPQ